jgi:GntR family transcriptional regulator
MSDVEIVVDVSAPEPVYEQIVRQIHDGVEHGRIQPGAPLPTVRQLADDLAVNRNTVARAYKLLEEQGIIQTAGRKGTFVRRDASREVVNVKAAEAQRALQRLVHRLASSGLSRTQMSTMFEQAVRSHRAKG